MGLSDFYKGRLNVKCKQNKYSKQTNVEYYYKVIEIKLCLLF